MDYETLVDPSRPEAPGRGGRPPRGTDARAGERPDRYVALVESSTFIRECLHRGMEAALSLPVLSFSTLSELESAFNDSVSLVFLCLADAKPDECANALKIVTSLKPSVPIVILATTNDMELARIAINFGAKGYIPCTTNFEIAIEAVRFILAGGTYVPMTYLLGSGSPNLAAPQAASLSNVLTDREMSVVRAIREGKSNKIIAYQLCICEGTVKVHLRNIMKKLKAKNRTDVAIKAQSTMAFDLERASPGYPQLSARPHAVC